MTSIAETFDQLIGNTPLIRLQKISNKTKCNILGKCEFMNPGGSIKDRTALGIIRDAEEAGTLAKGGTIVEGTAGNTGIGITLIANSLGYRSVVFMPMNQSREKIEQLEMLGAELHLVQSTKYQDPNHYTHSARRYAQQLNAKKPGSAIYADQFNNIANREIHRLTTGQEIWEQTQGNIDGFICSTGTGGTLAGIASALRQRKPAVKIGLVDPHGSSLYNHYTQGKLSPSDGNSIAEGIGISYITDNLKDTQVDYVCSASDAKALPLIYDLLQHQGLCLGGSSAINLAGALAMAEDMGAGHTIVTVLGDSGSRYQSQIYNPAFLQHRDLPAPPWL